MADELIQQAAPETSTATAEQAAPQFDLAAQMAIALNGGIPPQDAQTHVAPDATQEAGAATVVADSTVNDPFGIFKEKFGYETPEAAVKEIEELRAFKAQPRALEFQVPDDESGAMARAIAAGKKEEVWKILDHDLKIDRLISAEVTKDNAAEVVKMGMALKYKDLTPDEINYRFNKQFAIPPEPKQLSEEEDIDYQQRVDAWKEQAMDKQMELMIEAKLAKPEISNAKGKYVFPEIETPVDEGYLQYKQMLEENAKADQETKEAYKALTPKSVETKIHFKDEANKIGFEFQFEPDAEGFAKAAQTASNADLFWKEFINPDGSPNRTKFLDAIYYAQNKEKILMSALNQAKNATIKASLPDNTQEGLVRQMPQSQEPNELDRNMQLALKGYGNFK
jgi:hypothetical protein